MKYTIDVRDNGDIYWYKEGTVIHHRVGGPAIEKANGDKFWYENGLPHRLDGPACILANGIKQWYISGYEYPQEHFYVKVKELKREESKKAVIEKLSKIRDILQKNVSEYNKLIKENENAVYSESFLRLQMTSERNLKYYGELNELEDIEDVKYLEYEAEFQDSDKWSSSSCY